MKYIKLFENDVEYEAFVSGGTMVKPNVSYCVQDNEVHYNPIKTMADEYLTFIALEDGQFAFTNTINYSLDEGDTWTTLTAEQPTPTVTSGNKIMWKGELNPIEENGIGTFSSSGRFDAQGNIMSLLYGDDFKNKKSLSGKNGAFFQLFGGAKIVNANNLILPATTLSYECYFEMFQYCQNLISAPKLPATTLEERCYVAMFQSCTSLTTAPALLATTLAGGCYQGMFQDCTSLTVAPELPATTLALWCYAYMFAACYSLTTAPELPATTLAQGCYFNMFYGCNGITSAPELPSIVLVNNCYENMFGSCTSLTTAPELPATTLADGCYSNMFYGCTSLTNAAVVPNAVKPVGGEYCCGMYALTNIQQSPDYNESAWSEECE